MLESCLAVSAAQAGKARSAASTACIVSAVLITGTLASSLSFAGLVTGRDGVPIQAPLMKQASRKSDGSLRRPRKAEADCEARAAEVGVIMKVLKFGFSAAKTIASFQR